jgi:ATP-binding cassette, subfamily C, bacterial
VPLLLGDLVDAVSTGAPLSPRLLLVGAAVLLSAVFTALAQRAAERLGATVTADLREETLTRALGVEARVLERAGSGDVASRVTEDVENVVASAPLVAEVCTATVTVVVAAAGFATLDWRLTLAFTVVFPIYALSLWRYLPRAGPRYAEERRAAAERGRVMLESLHGWSTVYAYDMAELQTRRLDRASEQALTSGLRAARLYVWFSKAMNAAEAVGLCLVLLAGYWLVDGSVVTVGEVTAAALLFHRLFAPLGTLLLSFDDVQRAGAALTRIIGVTLLPPTEPRPSRKPVGPCGITARGLRFSYDVEVLHGIDIDVPGGTSLAIVGTSGAGKTTLAGVLAGDLPASTGTTTLHDSHGRVDLREARDWLGMISQETHVLTGPLRDDLTFAAPHRTDEDVRAALDIVGATWATDLDTHVGPGELTAAQAQQLALARMALRDPPIVILDEATAEAGSSGARDLEKSAAALTNGRTAIVIAHRLTQARSCDRIAVLDNGMIAEQGTHDELLGRGGRYAELWAVWSSRQPAS